jgi:hypothetical protein
MRKVKRFLKRGAQQHYNETVLSEAQYDGGCRLYSKSNQAGEAPDHILFLYFHSTRPSVAIITVTFCGCETWFALSVY